MSYSSWNDGGCWNVWGGKPIKVHTAAAVKATGNGTAGHAKLHAPEMARGAARDQFLDRWMWADGSSHASTEKEELADRVASKIPIDLNIDGEGSSRSYVDGSIGNDVRNPVSRKLKQRRIHKLKQRANFSARIASHEDLEARMEHAGSLGRGHNDEDPDRAMTKAECEAIAEDVTKKIADARELLHLKRKRRVSYKLKQSPHSRRH